MAWFIPNNRFALTMLLTLGIWGCGSRTELSATQMIGANSTGGSGGTHSGGGQHTGGQGASPQGGSGQGGSGGTEEPPCVLEPIGSPQIVLEFVDRHSNRPRLAWLSQEQGTHRIALVALASGGSSPLHPDIQITRLTVDDTIAVDQSPQLLGPQSHTWTELAYGSGREQLAIAWYSDPGQVGRVAFRALDVTTWSASPQVDLSFDGSAALALVAGPSAGPFGVGYGDQGYGVAWRESDYQQDPVITRTMVAVLNDDGAIQLGPHQQGTDNPYPGISPTMTWTGETYLLASGPGDITIERFRPASGDTYDDSGIELVTNLPTNAPPSRPKLGHDSNRTWVAWTEGIKGAPRTVHTQRLSAQGNPLGNSNTAATNTVPRGGISLAAASFGTLVAYSEGANASASSDQIGHSQIRVLALGADGLPFAGPRTLWTTRQEMYSYPALTALENPRGALLAWSAVSPQGLATIWAQQLRCVDVEPCDTNDDCSPDQFCSAPCCGESGHCVLRPTVCDPDCPGAVACGGDTFCGECEANANGLIAPQSYCPAALHHARVLPPAALDRVAITKAEPLYDICFRLILANGTSGPFGVSVTGTWGVESVAVRQGAGDCVDMEVDADWVFADDGSGSIDLTIPSDDIWPCWINLDAVFYFPPGQPWTPSLGAFLANALRVIGC